MSKMIPVNLLHEYYNEKFKTEAKKYECMIEQLNTKVTSLKSEVSIVNKVNQSLKSKLHSANNMIRILTSNRELDYDFTKVDRLLCTELIENNCSGDSANNKRQNTSKEVDSTRNVGLMRVQNQPVMQRRNFLKTQHIQTQHQKAKPVANVNTKTSKIPVFIKPSKKNLMHNNKENIAPPKNTTVANRKTEAVGIKLNVNKSKRNTLLKNNTTDNQLKKVEKDIERQMIPLNKTYLVDH